MRATLFGLRAATKEKHHKCSFEQEKKKTILFLVIINDHLDIPFRKVHDRGVCPCLCLRVCHCLCILVGQVYLDIPFSKVYEGGVGEDGHQDQHQ